MFKVAIYYYNTTPKKGTSTTHLAVARRNHPLEDLSERLIMISFEVEIEPGNSKELKGELSNIENKIIQYL